MNGEQIAERLGQMSADIKHVVDKVESIGDKLDNHIHSEEDRLKKIENQLNLGRFLFLTAKAIVLTVAFLFAFKFGDISSLWKAVLK